MERETLRDRIMARVAAALGMGDHPPPSGKPDLAPLLMPTMMERFGLDRSVLAATSPDLVSMLEARCRQCAVKSLCMDALSRGVTVEGAQLFCPNASTFETLRSGETLSPGKVS